MPAGTEVPDFAKPRVEQRSDAADAEIGTVPYRALTRGDFRGAKPHPRVAEHAARLGAYVCVQVVAGAGNQIAVEALPDGGGYAASARELAYIAVLDPDCSWWNEAAPQPAEYTLQHEQIHFALAELTARDLTRRIQELEIVADTREEAEASFQREAAALMGEAGQRLAARNLAFDEDTSVAYRPEVQADWYRTVVSELHR